MTICLLSSPAAAACRDYGYGMLAAEPKFVILCEAEQCEEARLTRTCGNIHYSSHDYETAAARWLFRVRYNEIGEEHFVFTDDQRSGTFSDQKQPTEFEKVQVTCITSYDSSSCSFINSLLRPEVSSE